MPANANEQLFLELINSARLDPLGDADRYILSYSGPEATSDIENIDDALHFFHVSGSALLQGFNALNPARPIAWNEQLGNAARDHSQEMIDHDTQSHLLPGEQGLGDRINAAGYAFTNVGENIYAFTKDPLYGHAGFMVDWGPHPANGGIQPGALHRVSIMNPIFREVGIDVTAHPVVDDDVGQDVGPLVVTQDFGRRGESGVFILGVAYTDSASGSKNDNFYSVGEGESGLRVKLGGASVVSAAAGGYTLFTNATGQQTITFSGADAGLAAPVKFTTTLANGMNIKLDVIDGNTLQTSASGTVAGSDIKTVKGLGLTGLDLTAGSGAQTLIGTKGGDTLNGGSGSDKMSGGAGNDTYLVSASGDTVTESSGKGTDTVRSAVSYRLPGSVEKLTLTGSGDINGTGNGANNTLTGNAGDNVLTGGDGNDILKGGAGDDTLVWSPSDTFDGGSSTTEVGDTLKVNGLSPLDLTTLATGKIKNIERIDLAGTGITLTVNAEEVVDISSDDTLWVLGDVADSVNMGGGWTRTAEDDRDLGGHDYHAYTQSSATLLVDSDIIVVL